MRIKPRPYPGVFFGGVLLKKNSGGGVYTKHLKKRIQNVFISIFLMFYVFLKNWGGCGEFKLGYSLPLDSALD
jgi:hypothetical protein